MAKKEETKQNEGTLRFYNQLRAVPDGALKKIKAGRLSGMSDINPVWRIQIMTATFGPCGFGWKYEIVKQWHEPFTYQVERVKQENNQWINVKEEVTEIKAFCNINLYIKVDGEWSDPIPGTGGSSFVAQEKNGPYVSDESEKMALTDALSVAMKALGVAADVYFDKGVNLAETKYEQQSYVQQEQQSNIVQQPQNPQYQVVAFNQDVQKAISSCQSEGDLMVIWNSYPSLQGDKQFRDAWAAQRGVIGKQ